MIEFYCSDSKETEKVGRAIGIAAGEGDVICLGGDLGAGKTTLSRGIALAKGVNESEITSPTFAIMNVYQGSQTEIRHFDLYRLDRADELEDIGFAEYVGGTGLTIIEWADLFWEEMPEEYLQVDLANFGSGRKVTLVPHGGYYEMLCGKVEEIVNFRD